VWHWWRGCVATGDRLTFPLIIAILIGVFLVPFVPFAIRKQFIPFFMAWLQSHFHILEGCVVRFGYGLFHIFHFVKGDNGCSAFLKNYLSYAKDTMGAKVCHQLVLVQLLRKATDPDETC